MKAPASQGALATPVVGAPRRAQRETNRRAARAPWLARGRVLLPWLLPTVLVGAWWLLTDRWHVVPSHQLPGPRDFLAALAEQLRSGEYLDHLLASLRRILIGFGAGSAAALALGVAVGLSSVLERIIDPTLQAIRSVPSLAWIPFLILWLGIGETPKAMLVAIGAFFPLYLNVVAGLKETDPRLIEVGRVYGLSPREIVTEIVLPSARPYVLTGLRIGLGQSWLFLVAAELIAATRGFGFMLIDGQNNLRPDLMLVGILSLALIGKLSDQLLRRLLPASPGGRERGER